MGLYDLDNNSRRKVIGAISAGFKDGGYRRVPTKKDEFVSGYVNSGIEENVKALAERGVVVECTPEEAYSFYDDLMR